MTAAPHVSIRDAVVLAAGNGDRFRNHTRQTKLLQPVLGRPLILRTLATAAAAGITAFDIVLGYQARRLRDAIERDAPPGVSLRFTLNPDWHLENGVSARAVRERFLDRRFALLMGDHLFDANVLSGLLRADVAPDESILAIDSQPAPPELAAEATKVRIEGDRILAIGKDLQHYNALDTGLFVFSPQIFAALDDAFAAGDTTLSGGIQRLAARGLMRARDIGDATWHDIDTVADLETAEALLVEPEHA